MLSLFRRKKGAIEPISILIGRLIAGGVAIYMHNKKINAYKDQGKKEMQDEQLKVGKEKKAKQTKKINEYREEKGINYLETQKKLKGKNEEERMDAIFDSWGKN